MVTKSLLRLGSRLISMKNGLVMGILNATPDSFYTGSRIGDRSELVERVNDMISKGMDILDIGAVSTRPGASLIPPDEEWERLHPLLMVIRKNFPDLPLSVDTFRSEVAFRAVNDFGVNMINDISAGSLDEKMPETIAALQVPVVLMHMKGLPETMQQNTGYDDFLNEVFGYLIERAVKFRESGVNDIILDPGFGFGKSLSQNFELLKDLDKLVALGFPVLVGISRKSMIYKSLDITADDALNGTAVVHTVARLKGASFFRVHDVKEVKECLQLVNQVLHPESIM